MCLNLSRIVSHKFQLFPSGEDPESEEISSHKGGYRLAAYTRPQSAEGRH